MPAATATRPAPVDVDTRAFELTYGKRPAGRGSWAFFFEAGAHADEAFWSTGTYADARKAAIARARFLGVSTVYVGT